MADAILILTMDECRFDALSCYGGQAVGTPHMDALAAEGVRFDCAMTPSPVCLPARCALLSGQYPHRTGLTSNTTNRLLASETPNLFNLATQVGWKTAMFGKCHFTPTPYGQFVYGKPLPGKHIHDYLRSLGIGHLDLCDGKVTPFWVWDDYSLALQEAGLFDQVAYPGQPAHARIFSGPEEWHPDLWTGRRAANYIRNYESEVPLLMWVSYPGPHYPHDPPRRYLERVDESHLPILRFREGEFDGEKAHALSFRREAGQQAPPWICEGGARDGGSSCYEADEWREIQRHYLANVALIDDSIGEVVAAARERFGSQLHVFLTADHGDMMGAHRLWGKGYCAYEEVVKVPFVAVGPKFPSGVSRSRVSLLDILPTVCCLTGADAPARCDGRDLWQSLGDGGHEVIFSSLAGLLVVDDGRWRLSMNHLAGTTELYDRAVDSGEYNNLAHIQPGKEARERLERAALRHLLHTALDPTPPRLPVTDDFLTFSGRKGTCGMNLRTLQ